MPRRTGQSFPGLKLHKATGRAYVVVPTGTGGRRFVYFGRHGTPEAEQEYRRFVARLAASPDGFAPGGAAGGDLTVNELVLIYVRHASAFYRDDEADKPTGHVDKVKATVRKLVDLYGGDRAEDFGPKALKVVMNAWVSDGNSRKVVNGQSQIVKRLFRWAVSEELLPPACLERLRAVEGLRKGRTSAPDRPPVKPADPEHVAKALAHMTPPVRAIATLQKHSGARAGQIVRLRPADLDTTGDVRTYTAGRHKGAWRGKTRTVWLGKTCQDTLRPFLEKAEGPEDFIFSPRRWLAEMNARRAAERKTPAYPSHMRRNAAKRKKRPKTQPGRRYTTNTYGQAIERACLKAGVPVFTPHQLRHLAGTLIRAEFGVDVARAMLGHSLASVTEIYSKEVDRELAAKAARKLG